MNDRQAELDSALDRVVAAARAHLATVRAAAGHEDPAVWRAFVELNNATAAYDELVFEVFDEVTPWDVKPLDEAELVTGHPGGDADDPYQATISVRQRRDYRVSSVTALIRAAEQARERVPHAEDEEIGPIDTVGSAVVELLAAGTGALDSLDIPELEPLDGVVVIAEVAEPLDLEAYPAEDVAGPFAVGSEDRVVERVDEPMYLELDDEFEDDDLEEDEEDERAPR